MEVESGHYIGARYITDYLSHVRGVTPTWVKGHKVSAKSLCKNSPVARGGERGLARQKAESFHIRYEITNNLLDIWCKRDLRSLLISPSPEYTICNYFFLKYAERGAHRENTSRNKSGCLTLLKIFTSVINSILKLYGMKTSIYLYCNISVNIGSLTSSPWDNDSFCFISLSDQPTIVTI